MIVLCIKWVLTFYFYFLIGLLQQEVSENLTLLVEVDFSESKGS